MVHFSKTPFVWHLRCDVIPKNLITFASEMYIKAQKKWRKSEDGSVMVPYTYYRLCESYRGENGHTQQRMVFGLGELKTLHDDSERKELARLLDGMIGRGQYLMSERQDVYELALSIYSSYKDDRRKDKLRMAEDSRLKEESRRKAEELKRELVTINWKSMSAGMPRSIGAEHICFDMLRRLGIDRFLLSLGWSRLQCDIACMQIVARAIYPCSELRTVSYLRENSALCEMFGIDHRRVTKDMLYKSSRDLYGIHREMEDYLHKQACSMFEIEEKILLFDITNMYAEGVYESSQIFQYGHSKERRNDLKVVVLAAVVNTDGLLVRTEIFEGNRQDVTTLEEMIGSLEQGLNPGRRVIVMDAGFSSKSNLLWLKNNNYDYITVMRSSGIHYTPLGEVTEMRDNKDQHIRLQSVKVEKLTDNVLMVDSDAKALKEDSMHKKASTRYEQGLEAIHSGIQGKGIKNRDKVNNRLGRLNARYPGMERLYQISFTYDEKNKTESMFWNRNEELEQEEETFHGKYFLQTSLDEKDAKNIWSFYNVIRTVEETFKTLKTDLDIRPIYHKSDEGAKAHLNLAVLAYWIVSTVRYRLRKAGVTIRWEELLRIMSTQVRVTMSAQKSNGNTLSIRRSTEPEDKLAKIYDILEMPHKPVCSAKFVWHLKPPPKNNDG